MHLHDRNQQIVEQEWQQQCGDRFGRKLCYIHPQLASYLGAAKPGLPPRAPFFQWLSSLKSLPCLVDGATKPPPQFGVDRALTAVLTSETNSNSNPPPRSRNAQAAVQGHLAEARAAAAWQASTPLHSASADHPTRPRSCVRSTSTL